MRSLPVSPARSRRSRGARTARVNAEAIAVHELELARIEYFVGRI